MNTINWLPALAGGAMSGFGAAGMLLLHRRIAGVSGIYRGALERRRGDLSWRILYLAGLAASGLIASWIAPDSVRVAASTPVTWLLLAGLLVGGGAHLANGCTSGHGVCGVARGSPRSIVAATLFALGGMLISAMVGGLR